MQALLDSLIAAGLQDGADASRAASGSDSGEEVASSQVHVAASQEHASSEANQGESAVGEDDRRRRAKKLRKEKYSRRLCDRLRKGKIGRTAMRQLKAQALDHARHGRARTRDNVMMQQVDNWVPERLRRSGRGTGRWKTHAPESMCRAAFANLHSSFATKAVDGSCKSHALHCTWLAAGVVHSASQRATDDPKRPLASVSGTSSDVDDFHISNGCKGPVALVRSDSAC